MNDRSLYSGGKNESLLPAKSKGSLGHFGGFLVKLANGSYWPARVGRRCGPVRHFLWSCRRTTLTIFNWKGLDWNAGLVCTGTVAGFQLELVAVLDWNTQGGICPGNWMPPIDDMFVPEENEIVSGSWAFFGIKEVKAWHRGIVNWGDALLPLVSRVSKALFNRWDRDQLDKVSGTLH